MTEETMTAPFAEAEPEPSAKEEKRAARGDRIRIEQHGGVGLLWLAGWLFTIGFLHLSFWKAVLAVAVWPYYIGAMVKGLLG